MLLSRMMKTVLQKILRRDLFSIQLQRQKQASQGLFVCSEIVFQYNTAVTLFHPELVVLTITC
jgi:hypothetical protein